MAYTDTKGPGEVRLSARGGKCGSPGARKVSSCASPALRGGELPQPVIQ